MTPLSRWRGAGRPFIDWVKRAIPIDGGELAEHIESDKPLFDYANHLLTLSALWAAVTFAWVYLPKVNIAPYADITSLRIGLSAITVFLCVLTVRFASTTLSILREITSGLWRSPYLLVKLFVVVPAGGITFIMGGVYALVVSAIAQINVPGV